MNKSLVALAVAMTFAFGGNVMAADDSATISQAGDNNTAAVVQTNSLSSQAAIDQSGKDNAATLIQSSADKTSGAIEQFEHRFRTEIRGTTPALAAASFPRDDADSPYPGAFCNPT